MSSTLFEETLVVPFQEYKDDSHADIPSLIEYLAIICQETQTNEHELAFDELETIITNRVDCEDEAATAKTIISTLFQTITNRDTVSPELPVVVAELTASILAIIPDTMTDWTRPEHSEQGKPLFLQLFLEGLNFYWPPENGHEEQDTPCLYSSLQQSTRVQLSDFIRELADRSLIHPLVVHAFIVGFLHSMSVPTPTPSELECVCRLLRAQNNEVRDVLWTESISNALEIIRARDGTGLEQKIHVLLLVLPSFKILLNARKQYG